MFQISMGGKVIKIFVRFIKHKRKTFKCFKKSVKDIFFSYVRNSATLRCAEKQLLLFIAILRKMGTI